MNTLTIITSKIIDSSISPSLIENFPYKKKKVTNEEKSLLLGKVHLNSLLISMNIMIHLLNYAYLMKLCLIQ